MSENVETRKITGKLFFSQRVAKRLLNMGNDLVSVQPNRKHRESAVFIFGLDDKLMQDFERTLDEKEESGDPNLTVVTSIEITNKLLEEGYKVVDINPDRYNSDRTVFFFETSDDLLSEINRLEKKRKNNLGEKTVEIKVKSV